MWERLELIIPRFLGAVGGALGMWSVAKVFTIEDISVEALAVLITAAFAGYSTIHKLVSSKMNPGDSASVLTMQIEKEEEAAREGD